MRTGTPTLSSQSLHSATLVLFCNDCVLYQESSLPIHLHFSRTVLPLHRSLFLSPFHSCFIFLQDTCHYPPRRVSFRSAGASLIWCCWAVWSILMQM